MGKNLRILNEFGITPTNTYTSAGADFYVPYISKENYGVALESFVGSFGKSIEELNNIISIMSKYVSIDLSEFQSKIINILHLYLSLDSYTLRLYTNEEEKIKIFCSQYLIFDKNGVPGYQLQNEDLIKINSGIRVALEPNTAGIFFNKSGKGNNGLDIRACVVDEDYTGFVHCSLAYTKNLAGKPSTVYCGDKITQMVVLPVIHMDPEEITEDEYYKLMENSERGNDAFGSSDVKH